MPTLPIGSQGADAHDNPDAAANAQGIAANYDFIGQYIDQFSDGDGQPSFPPFTYAQATQEISATTPSNGPLQIQSIFETNGMSSSVFSGGTTFAWENYLTFAQGVSDAKEAYASAQAIGQPYGTAIYFAMDFDPAAFSNAAWTNPDSITPSGGVLDEPTILKEIVDYFQGVNSVLGGEPAGKGYTVGAYGAVDTLLAVSGQLGSVTGSSTSLASYTWRTQSTGWAGNYSTSNGGASTVGNNGTPWSVIQEAGSTTAAGVAIDPDTNQVSNIGTWDTQMPLCFCRGTLILTEEGEVPVENLTIGDRVKTLSGALRPIMWIGMGRDLVAARHSLSRPIIVRRGALAENVPTRDLYVTHGHALYLSGVLIPVENLVNHRSILWDETARVVEYYHIELEDHDVMFANGAPAESYYDAGNRALFQNIRPGSSEAGEAKPTFAPVLNGGPLVDIVWRKLYDRAGGDVVGVADDPDLHLSIDGEYFAPQEIADGIYTFALERPPAAPTQLNSRRGVPSLSGVSVHDHRVLGVAIRRIEIRQLGLVRWCLDHRSPLLQHGGCYPAEESYSWTDGELELPRQLFTPLSGPLTLIVQIERLGMRYPTLSTVAQAA